MEDRHSGGLLRGRDEADQHVTPVELFFDLVFIFAVTQLSHLLLDHLTVRGAAETLLLLLVVWSAWVTTTWVTNWFDPNLMPVRLMLVAVMLASLFMSVAIPEAFGERGLMFAGAYVAIHLARAAFAFVSLRLSLGGRHPLTRTFERTLSWHALAGVLWISGGLVEGQGRYLLWVLALAINLGAPLIGYYLPGLGRSRTSEWALNGAHFTERFQLFIIIALGESLLVTGATFGDTDTSASTISALVVAFIGSVSLWWIYFHRSARAAGDVISASTDPGRLARSAYTYFHLPMVAGIIAVAAADELTLAHPDEHGTPASVVLTFGGPALYLAGHALFRRAIFGTLPPSHLVAIVALAVLAPAGRTLPTLAAATMTTLIIAAVAAWETLRQPAPPS